MRKLFSVQNQTESIPSLSLVDVMTGIVHARAVSTTTHFKRGNLPRFCFIPESFIIVGRYQPRSVFDEEKIQELAEDIKRRGIINPLKVFVNEKPEREEFELIAGERRLRAARLAGLRMVYVEIVEASLAEIAEISLVDNLQRENLSAIEEGQAYEAMIKHLGISESELAHRVGKSRGYIQQRRAIANAHPSLSKAIEEGKITLTMARIIAQSAAGDHAAQERTLALTLEKIKLGRNITESDIRKDAEAHVRHNAQEGLRKLGWSVSEDIIWSDTMRPEKWTTQEMIKAVREKKTPPVGTHEPAVLSEEVVQLIELKYYPFAHNYYAPWVRLKERGASLDDMGVFCSTDEVFDWAKQVKEELADLKERFRAHDWELTWRGQVFHAKAKGGNTYENLFWTAMVVLLERIEKSMIAQSGDSDGDSDKTKVIQVYPCSYCGVVVLGQEISTYPAGSGKLCCPACREKKEAEFNAIIAQKREEILAEAPDLQNLPERIIRQLLCLIKIELTWEKETVWEYWSPQSRMVLVKKIPHEQLLPIFFDSLAKICIEFDATA